MAPAQTPAPTPAPTPTPAQTPVLAPEIIGGLWQQHYVSEINKLSSHMFSDGVSYKLLFINDDNIPELLLDFAGRGINLYTATNAGADLISFETNPVLNYIELGNKVVISTGRMDDYYDALYEINNGRFNLLLEGNRRTRDSYVPAIAASFDFANAITAGTVDISPMDGTVTTQAALIAIIEGLGK